MIRERILDQVISSLENSAHDQGLSGIIYPWSFDPFKMIMKISHGHLHDLDLKFSL